MLLQKASIRRSSLAVDIPEGTALDQMRRNRVQFVPTLKTSVGLYYGAE